MFKLGVSEYMSLYPNWGLRYPDGGLLYSNMGVGIFECGL